MIYPAGEQLERFQSSVGIKFQLYNSLFLSLPFYGVDRTGILLSLFSSDCEDGYAAGKSPIEIVDDFFASRSELDPTDLLFRFVQYAERQVVLFDALEDAAFSDLNDPEGPGTLAQLISSVIQNGRSKDLIDRLREFSVRIVLTAHPTQFYPGSVLGIINDLEAAIKRNDVGDINTLLQQLGRTPFLKKTKPTPFDEAASLIWYLENVFYDVIGGILTRIKNLIPEIDGRDLVRMGFWPGGDRDGNPFVTSEMTLQVATALRKAILRCYYRDIRRLRRRLTFASVEHDVAEIEEIIYREAFQTDEQSITAADIRERLVAIRGKVINEHNGLFVELVDDLIQKVSSFGLYFASMDIRQESSAHTRVIESLQSGNDNDELARDTIKTIKAIKTIQNKNGQRGAERYIISQCGSKQDVMNVMELFALAGISDDDITIDIVPLFETIEDLKQAPRIMRKLYEDPRYRHHLDKRNSRQTIMLGFSDGTKDGGYLMANWSIYRAKDELTRLAREFSVSVIFFDGRGGPPARGGGKTHKFYSSMGENIADDQIQLTVQGQTVSSNFGSIASAGFNIEQLIHAGTYNEIFSPKTETFSEDETSLMHQLAAASYESYSLLKNDPLFLDYLANVSPLPFYTETNIGSRPAKRGSGQLNLSDLRAIPFVGAWSQLKQNVPGFYGVGTAIKAMEKRINELSQLYRDNGFFKALIDNCEMAMVKSYFPLTQFLAFDTRYSEIWNKLKGEYDLTREMLAAITGNADLMSDLPAEGSSVRTRERIVLPLVTIQQYALTQLRENSLDDDLRQTYEKLVIRCSFGIINAGRNSA